MVEFSYGVVILKEKDNRGFSRNVCVRINYINLLDRNCYNRN